MRVGLTGGIAAGKSLVADRLRELGAVVIDADLLAREVVEPGMPGLAAVRAAFGDDIVAADGRLDRPKLGALVFGDQHARTRLEAIVHPLVRAAAAAIEADAIATDPAAIVVHDIPLLVETGQADGSSRGRFDHVVVVDAPTDVQLERLIRDRGFEEQQARDRIAAQATREQRLAAADTVLVNDATPAELYEQIDTLWTVLRARQ